MIYDSPEIDVPISQGDIIDGCPLFRQLAAAEAVDLDEKPARWLSRVIVLTQACDLAHVKTNKVLVAAVHDAEVLVRQGVLKASAVRDQVRRGLVYGWYFLPASGSSIEVPESIVDLRDLHTISRRVLEHLVAQGHRVAQFVTPYREHLAQHFTVTYARIGLPEPFVSAP